MEYEINLLLPPTPRYILDTYAIDVFMETVGKLIYTPDPTVIDKLVDLCWLRYRNRPIGDFDHSYWLFALDDRVRELWYGYEKTIGILMGDDIASLAFNVVKDAGTISRVGSDLRTDNLTAESDANNSNTQSGTILVENEDNPDTSAGATKYLSNKSTTTPGQIDTGVASGTVNNTGTVDHDITETETRDLTNTTNMGLDAETALKMNDAVNKCVQSFSRSLDDLFMNRW